MLDFLPTEKDIPDPRYQIELWKPVDSKNIPGVIENRYFISTWGRFFDSYNGNYYPTENVTSTSYPSVHVQFIDGSYKTLKIHHIMMRAFRPFDYSPETHTDIDHKDGVMYHNWIWNIERVTHQENIRRCVDIGLYPLAENQQNAILTNNQVREICKLISEGYMVSEIVKSLKPSIPVISKHLVNDIKGKRNYTSISKDYDFSNMYYQNTQHMRYDNSIIENMCQTFEEYGKGITPKEMYEIMYDDDLAYQSSEEQMHFRDVFYNLKKKKCYKNICNKYNY